MLKKCDMTRFASFDAKDEDKWHLDLNRVMR